MSVLKEKKELKNGVAKNCFTILNTNECLKMDKNKINFCKYPVFASSFKQIAISLELLDYFTEQQRKQYHLLRIKASSQFPHERIFTVKAVQNGEENTDLELPLKAGDLIQLFVRVNIPELLCTTDISGTLTLQINDFAPIVLPIASRGEVPQIVCLKQIESIKTGTKIIKIPSKGIMKIPFKNCSNINFFFEIKLIGKDVDSPDTDGVKVNVMQNGPNGVKPFQEVKNNVKECVIKVEANTAFCVTLALELLKKDNNVRVARRILVLQVQGTKLLFPFPLEIIIAQ